MRERLSPMLAVSAQPFDSPEYLFEVKWDGVRALSAGTTEGWQLWGREGADYRGRYPELAGLAALPEGTVLDGEIVLLSRGVPDLDALLARHAPRSPAACAALARSCPVRYVVFDALRDAGQSLLSAPLLERRRRAQQLMAALADQRVGFSEGVVGDGRAFFERAVAAGQEGVMAKHLASPYRPGRRCACWKKIKPCALLPAVIIGYLPGPDGVRGLLVAALHQGRLRYAGLLRSGLGAVVRRLLADRLRGSECPGPALSCPRRAVWVQPQLYCQVRYLRWTPQGLLYGASFQRLLDATPATLLPGAIQ